MKILCVGYRVPWPIRDGGNVRDHGLLGELGRRHDVTYLCRTDATRPEAERRLRALCGAVELFVDPFRVTWSARLAAVLRRQPFGVIGPSDAFFRRFHDVLFGAPFDLVYLVGVDAALLALQARPTTPVVWDPGDCTSRYYEREARGQVPVWRALWARRQASRYRALERRLLAADLATIVTTPSEAQALERVAGGRPGGGIHVIPTGVAPAPAAAPARGPARLTFTGALGYPPNADAVLHFCREILPRVRRARPDVLVEIIGDGASPALRSACPDVTFLGFVPDVLEALRRATLVVCPMRRGTGIRVKLLEAMACGLPIVASAMAVEGMPEARDGRHLSVAGSPGDFARRILELLDDPARRSALGASARELARDYHWDRLGERLDRVCREVVARRAGASRRGTEDGR